MATQIVNKINYNGKVYKLQDSDALPLAGGNVTGPVEFNDTVTMQQASVENLVITGNASSTNNLQVNTINGVAVGANPHFTDTTYNIATASANGLMPKEDKQFIDALQIGGRNLLIDTEKKLFQEVSSTFEIPYQLSLYAQNKNVFRVQNEVFTISFDYEISNIGGIVTVKINNLNEVLLDIGNKYENSINQNITANKMTYKRTFKITQEQANSINTSFKIVFNNLIADSTITIENVKLEYGNVATDYSPSPEELGWEPQLIAPEGDKVQYQGEEVSFNISNKPNVYIQQFKRAGGTSGASDENSWQGMDIYGKYLFRSKINGMIYVYDLTEDYQNLSIIDSFQLGSYRTSGKKIEAWGLTFDTSNHAGVLCFTDKKFNNNDEFPLLLVSDGSGSGTKGIEGKGFCYIQRIQRTGNKFTSTTVGVIQLRWEAGKESDYTDPTKGLTSYFFFPWCQWHYYNGYIYSFGHKRRGTGVVSKKFNEHVLTRWHPDILTLINRSATNSGQAKITRFFQGSYKINDQNISLIDNQWYIEYAWDYLDGCRFYDDKIIATYGHGTQTFPNKIVIFSLASTTAIATIDLSKMPIAATKVMEGCAIYNNKILLGFTGNAAASKLYLLSFVKNKTGEVANPISIVTTSTNGLMSATDKKILDALNSSYILNPNLQPSVFLTVDPLMSAFRTIGILGDSYATGSIHHPDTGATAYPSKSISWGKQIGRHFDIDVMNYAKSGRTAKDFLNSTIADYNTTGWGKFDSDLSSVADGGVNQPKDLYILAFGINDFRKIHDKIDNHTMGTLNDITNYSNISDSSATNYYLKSPTSFYGSHNRIIRHIQKKSPYSIILQLSYLRPAPVGEYDVDTEGNFIAKSTINSALQQIANSLGILFINIENDPFFSSDFYKINTQIYYHPNAVGYAGMARGIERLISRAIMEHPSYFDNLGRIAEPNYI